MKYILAISGGVDSCTSAKIFNRLGYKFFCVFLNLLNKISNNSKYFYSRCCSSQDYLNSKKFCKLNKIDFYSLDFINEFNYKIYYNFIKDFCINLTPVPCITCNSEIKVNFLCLFSFFFKYTLVTGHYCCISLYKNYYSIKRPFDFLKDQTYFLYRTNYKLIKFLFFPLAGILKKELRIIAKLEKVFSYIKPDSSEICFIGNQKYWEFIYKKYGSFFSGDFLLLENNKKIGNHFGSFKYTICQRKGIGFFLNKKLYVFKKNKNNCNIYLSEKKYLNFSIIFVNFFCCLLPIKIWPEILFIKYRSLGILYLCKIKILNKNQILVKFLNYIFGLSEGQSAVFYSFNILLGGGIINKIIENDSSF